MTDRLYWELKSRIPKELPFYEHEKIARSKLIEPFWNYLTPYQKHIIYMYLYRVHTETDISGFIEVIRFSQMQICITDLPNFVVKMSPEKLYKGSYREVGRQAPTTTAKGGDK